MLARWLRLAPRTGAAGRAYSTERRRVVSSFLCTGSPGAADFRVAVFRRARHRRVYAGKWSACAGGIEADDASAAAAALRELREETGLAAEDLEMVGQGGGYEGADEALGVRWEIWPFLWRVVRREGGASMGVVGADEVVRRIRLDGENDEVRFVTMAEMAAMDTVDGLERGVREALQGLGKEAEGSAR